MENITQGQWFRGPSADLGTPINQSLRFITANKTCLTKTLSQAGDDQTWTFSTWLKKAPHGTNYRIFTGGPSSAAQFTSFMLQSDNTIRFYSYNGSSVIHNYVSNPQFNDVSAWYHMVVAYDTNNATAADRIKIYVNGVRITDWSTETHPSSGYNSYVNRNGQTLVIGSYVGGTSNANTDNFIEGYLAETVFIDGSQLAPTEFGRTNENGVWVNKTYSGSYTGNSFRLVYDSSAGLGDDSSGLANDFVANNFESTAISSSNEDNDIDYNDTPTNNYTTLNPLQNRVIYGSGLNYEHANLRAQYGGGGSNPGHFTQGFRGGKFYWEMTPKVQVEMDVGLVSEDYDPTGDNQQFGQTANGWAWRNSATSTHNGTTVDPSHTAYGVGDTVGIFVDTDAGTAKIEVNGVAQSNSEFTNIPTNKLLYPALRLGGASGDANAEFNFGQMPFVHTQTGYNHVATNNLPEPTIKNGSEHCRVLTGTGANIFGIATGTNTNGTNWNSEVNTGFTDGLYWIKDLSTIQQWQVIDSVRGTSNVLQCPNNANETTYTAPSNNSIAYCWKGGGTAVSNTNGSITSSVSVNTDAGFSIATYTGNGTSATVGHGLTEAPDFIITRSRNDSNTYWTFYHSGMGNGYGYMNYDLAYQVTTVMYQGTSNTTWSYDANSNVNNSGTNYVSYLWHSVPGYSKFGTFEGNANADGPFVYLGFRPALLLLKNGDGANRWKWINTTRSVQNTSSMANLTPQSSSGETSGLGIDLLSNGFKVRDTSGDINASGTMIYCAWAENPFGGENQPPATAR